jgi:hypothetical protein
MTSIKSSDLEFIGEWMKKNDVIEFRQGDMVVRRFDAPPAKPVEEQKPSFDLNAKAEDHLTDDEKLFGVGAVEWR